MVFRYLVAVVAVEHNSVYGFLYFYTSTRFYYVFSTFYIFSLRSLKTAYNRY